MITYNIKSTRENDLADITLKIIDNKIEFNLLILPSHHFMIVLCLKIFMNNSLCFQNL